VINLDIFEKERRRRGQASVNFDKNIIEIERRKKSKIEGITKNFHIVD
jgi:hypothetical protein